MLIARWPSHFLYSFYDKPGNNRLIFRFPVMELFDYLIITLVALLAVSYLVWRTNSGMYQSNPIAKPPGPKPTAISQPTVSKLKSYLPTITNASGSPVAILFYGSQTGTAEDLATRFAKDLQDSYGFTTLVCDLEEYDTSQLEEWPESSNALACFFMATYGEGEPTDNAGDFYDYIMNGQGRCADEGNEPDFMTEGRVFSSIKYLIFGLGNKVCLRSYV